MLERREWDKGTTSRRHGAYEKSNGVAVNAKTRGKC